MLRKSKAKYQFVRMETWKMGNCFGVSVGTFHLETLDQSRGALKCSFNFHETFVHTKSMSED